MAKIVVEAKNAAEEYRKGVVDTFLIAEAEEKKRLAAEADDHNKQEEYTVVTEQGSAVDQGSLGVGWG